MASRRIQLAPELTDGEAHALVLREPLEGELISFTYNAETGIVNITTRATPAISEVLPESEDSKKLLALMEAANVRGKQLDIQSRMNVDRIKELDKREADNLRKERKIKKDRDQLDGERKQFDEDRGEVIKSGRFVGLKSFFHRIK